jgi:hypothetical protein
MLLKRGGRLDLCTRIALTVKVEEVLCGGFRRSVRLRGFSLWTWRFPFARSAFRLRFRFYGWLRRW